MIMRILGEGQYEIADRRLDCERITPSDLVLPDGHTSLRQVREPLSYEGLIPGR